MSKIYVACPANSATGGPELLHQLAYKLRQNGRDAEMLYTGAGDTNPVPEPYKAYAIPYTFEAIDKPEHALVAPEIQTQLLAQFKHLKRYLWWLSVDNHFLAPSHKLHSINKKILSQFQSQRFWGFSRSLDGSITHLSQSEYSSDFLRRKGLTPYSLTDYLNPDFLASQPRQEKRNIVAYNPNKGAKQTRMIMASAADIEFVPIRNMTRQQVIQLLSEAKVYIDFGNHPGRDRIPREAAHLGCCVITGRMGAADNKTDIPIADDYKIHYSRKNIPQIVDTIRSCITNYATRTQDFTQYRAAILEQERIFEQEVLAVFATNTN